jgi:hypothetical protein
MGPLRSLTFGYFLSLAAIAGCNALFLDGLTFDGAGGPSSSTSSGSGGQGGAGGAPCMPAGDESCADGADEDCDVQTCGQAFFAKLYGDLDTNATITGVAAGTDGEVVIGGTYVGSLKLAEGITLTAATTGGFVAKLTKDGTVVWAKTLQVTAVASAVRVTLDKQGNVFAIVITNASGIFVAKLATDGAQDPGKGWNRLIGEQAMTVCDCTAEGLTLRSNGNPIVTGYFGGTLDTTPKMLTSVGMHDLFVLELDAANGTTTLAVGYGDAGDDSGAAIAVSSAGIIAVTGRTQGGGVLGPALFGSQSNPFLLYLNTSGAVPKAKQLGDGMSGNGRAVAFDASDRLLLAGDSAGQTLFDGTMLPPGAYVALLEGASFTPKWARSFGAATVQDMRVTPSGHAVLCGGASGTIDTGKDKLVPNGGTDAYALRYDQDGNPVWAGMWGGDKAQLAIGVDFDPAGRLLVGGRLTTSMTFSSTPNAVVLIAPSSPDGFLASIEQPK